MNQQTLENVVVLSQVRAPHPAGFVAVRETALDQLAPPTQQPLSLGPLQPLSIRVDGLLLAFFTNPMPLPILLLLWNVSAYASCLQLFQNGSTMVSLVGYHLFDTTQIHLRHFLRRDLGFMPDQFGYRFPSFRQRFPDRGRIA